MNAQKAYLSHDNSDFVRLMREGRTALNQGNRQHAHDLWREAAMLDPYNEQVWLALLEVLDAIEDRKVCLNNILAINPMNAQARQTLRNYEAKEQRQAHLRNQKKNRAAAFRQQRWLLLRRALLMGILIGLAGIFLAVILSILIYTVL